MVENLPKKSWLNFGRDPKQSGYLIVSIKFSNRLTWKVTVQFKSQRGKRRSTHMQAAARR